MPDVLKSDSAGELAGALDEHTIVEDVDADILAIDAVVTMGDGVHQPLKPRVLRVFGNYPELHCPMHLELVVAELGGDEVASLGDGLDERPVKRLVLHDAQFVAVPHFGAVDLDYPESGLRQNRPYVLSEQHHARP